MDPLDLARHLRHVGLEALKTAADLEAEVRRHRLADFASPPEQLAVYERDGVGRLKCCGAGSDQRDYRTGENLHMPFCRSVVASCEALA